MTVSIDDKRFVEMLGADEEVIVDFRTDFRDFLYDYDYAVFDIYFIFSFLQQRKYEVDIKDCIVIVIQEVSKVSPEVYYYFFICSQHFYKPLIIYTYCHCYVCSQVVSKLDGNGSYSS